MTSRAPPPDEGVPLIVMGASAGGVGALSKVIGGLPTDLGAGILVVLHIASDGFSVLPQILERAGSLPAHHASDGEVIEAGVVYVAPPDTHLLVDDGRIRLDTGPMENMARPSIDRLFASAAEARGTAVVGVVLSGMLDDGTAGLIAISEHGGVGVVQDPDEADFRGMPTSAVRYADPCHVVSLHQVAPLLESLVASSPTASVPQAGRGGTRPQADAVEAGAGPHDQRPVPGRAPSGLSCPACHGSLWEEERGELLTFRCRVGHGYSAESLAAAQVTGLEKALWISVTALEERAELSERLAARATARDLGTRARRYGVEADDARHRAATVRDALRHLGPSPVGEPPADGDRSAW